MVQTAINCKLVLIHRQLSNIVSDLRQVGTPVFSTNTTDPLQIIEILLKVALNTMTLTITPRVIKITKHNTIKRYHN